jgi:hypothetical protein
VGVCVLVGVTVGVLVTVGVTVLVGVIEGVGVTVDVGVGVGVGLSARQSGQLFTNESAVRTVRGKPYVVIAPTVKHPGGVSPGKVK